ncbi:MAG TPA: class I SAM-dependent methyltransferase [Solirubrobacteraceae bacterium]|nr:class I SAM-dependent methyltransferase [Solirubrobacteraceae bacterium]
MSTTLKNARVRRVLDQLAALGVREDAEYTSALAIREAELDQKLYGIERAQIGARAPLAIKPEVAASLYALVIAAEPNLIVEFGASLGFSTLYLASAMNDLGTGQVITSELIPDKAKATERNLAAAGLAHVVEVRQGDAQITFGDISATVDFVFLDGSNDLYLSILQLLEPKLAQGALVVADLSFEDPQHVLYRAHVEDPQNGYRTIEIPVDAGVLVSKRRNRK